MAKRESRLYQKRGRWYADFRDLGGKREALIPKGENRATTDADIAAKLVSDRVAYLEEQRRHKDAARREEALGIRRAKVTPLKRYAAEHLKRKAEDGEAEEQWLTVSQQYLERAVKHFGANTNIASLTPGDMTPYVDWLRRQPNRRGGTLSDSSVRKHLNTLSNLFKRALSQGLVLTNPVANMYSKPTEAEGEAEYLEPEEAALLLEAARTYKAPVKEQGANPHMYPIVAGFLLTGMRKAELLGLEVDDVSLRLGKIYLRPNTWRRLKTKRSKRTIPIWPQLREIWEAYMLDRERAGGLGTLLFPSCRSEKEIMITDVGKALDHIAERAGFPEDYIGTRMLRHTYTAARIQTLDRGVPVALYSVARELGHASTDMIEDRYGHLHDRAILGGSEVVEFRIETYREKLADRIRGLEAQGSDAVTNRVTNPADAG